MLQYALQYHKMGYNIIPLKPRSKEPLIVWAEYQTRKSTEKEIQDWWSSSPEANIGIVTGPVSALAVVDLDGPIGIASGATLGLHSAGTVRTGNGKQLYYYDPEGKCKNTVKKIADGVDTRGQGGYVVGPGSIHPNGKRYVALGSVRGVKSLPPFPEKLFAPSAMTTAPLNGTVFKNEEGWIAKSLEEMKDGNIDDTLFTVCSRLRHDGYSDRDAYTLLGPHAERAGATPGHLEEKIRNVWNRYEPKAHPLPVYGRSSMDSGMQGPVSLVIHSPTNSVSRSEFSERQLATNRRGDFPTGYEKFDALTGGLRRAEVLTVAARTGVGKTNWLIGPARTLCENGKKVLFFSTEMSFDQIWSRYRATLQNPQEFDRHEFHVCDEFAPNPTRIEEALKQVMPDVFIFDHINNVGDEHHQLSEFMKSLKFLARQFNIPCIMAAQLNRGADFIENGARIPPRLSHIKGSGTIEEISAQVLLLSETRLTLEGTEITGVVDKNRWGEKGMINFMLKQNPWRFVEV